MTGLVRRDVSDLWKRLAGADSLFDEIFSDPFFTRLTGPITTPVMNMTEEDGSFIIDLVVLGMDKENIDISVKDRVLTVTGHKEKQADMRYKICEYDVSRFVRSITLPHGVDTEKIEASFDRGILRIVMPAEDKANSVNIEIK